MTTALPREDPTVMGSPTNFACVKKEGFPDIGEKILGLRLNPPSPGKGRSSLTEKAGVIYQKGAPEPCPSLLQETGFPPASGLKISVSDFKIHAYFCDVRPAV